jgi:DNA-binding MarR family transcriptional regulator
MAQIGAHAAARFARRLAELELAPPHAGILRILAARSGISQHELAHTLGMLPPRLVPIIDELEERGLVERRANRQDRRHNALHLTAKGSETLAAVGRVAKAHDDEICASLSGGEREQLGALLRRVADEQRLTPGVHPGFSRLSGGNERWSSLKPRPPSRPKARKRAIRIAKK